MTRLERIARDLASVLSPQGEGDWRHYVPMAEVVGARLCRQLDEMMSRASAVGTEAGPHDRAGALDIRSRPELLRSNSSVGNDDSVELLCSVERMEPKEQEDRQC